MKSPPKNALVPEPLGLGNNRFSDVVGVNPAAGFVKDVEAARFLNCSVSRLRQDRFRGRGFPYYRWGRSILYKISDLAVAIEKTKIEPGKHF